MKKLFIGNLPSDLTEDAVRQLFSEYGTVRSNEIPADIFTGKLKGFGIVEMEGHYARVAVAEPNGKLFGGRPLKVNYEQAWRGGKSGRSR